MFFNCGVYLSERFAKKLFFPVFRSCSFLWEVVANLLLEKANRKTRKNLALKIIS